MDLAGRRIYIDANVLIYFLDGRSRLSDAATAALEGAAAQEWEAITSDLVLAEVLVGAYRSPEADAVRVTEALFAQPWLTLLQLSRRDFEAAAALRARRGDALVDALHLGTAANSGCDALLTNDRRLNAVAGVDVLALATG